MNCHSPAKSKSFSEKIIIIIIIQSEKGFGLVSVGTPSIIIKVIERQVHHVLSDRS